MEYTAEAFDISEYYLGLLSGMGCDLWSLAMVECAILISYTGSDLYAPGLTTQYHEDR